MKNINILSIRFPQLESPGNPEKTLQLLYRAKTLANENKHLFDEKEIDINIFHNSDIQYSGIQLGGYRGMMEWVAIGQKEVKALNLWYRIYKKQQGDRIQNTIVVKEKYTALFLNYQKKYKINKMLVNDDLAKELNLATDKFARHDRLEKYLYGNFQRFFKHIGFVHDKSENFLKIIIVETNRHQHAKQIYHKQKKTAFDVVFTCNFLLPQTLRLGQSTALGYGSVYHL